MSNLASLFDRYKALVIFDTETSGLNPGDDQIIELAVLREPGHHHHERGAA